MSRPKKSELAMALWDRTDIAHSLLEGKPIVGPEHEGSGWMECPAYSCKKSLGLFLRMQRSGNEGAR